MRGGSSLRWVGVASVLVAGSLLLVACGFGADSDPAVSEPPVAQSSSVRSAGSGPEVDVDGLAKGEARSFGPAPAYPEGDWSPEVVSQLRITVGSIQIETTPAVPLQSLAATGDPRLAWPLADVLRFTASTEAGALIQDTINLLTGLDLEGEVDWTATLDHLTAWDLPVPAQYVEFKRELFTQIDPRWGELLVDPGTGIDWRHVAWGGVLIDDRPAGSQEPCRCIPALDDPAVTPADEGDWYPDDRIVFGLVVEGEARAYPRNIMEVHEMVNDTLGGRRIGMPYCTLCGSAQAYHLDELRTDDDRDVTGEFPEPVLRTSGLLIRSNKMMYELNTLSFVDTFRGVATSGPLAEAGVVLTPLSVVTTTWGQWKAEHPDTTIVAEDGGLGRSYPLDPLGDRDLNGPIFPIGAVDPRLPVQEPVLGVVGPDGEPVAFHVAEATRILESGGRVEAGGFTLVLDGGGLRAVRADDSDAKGHQSFWFAWSQFRPTTRLWPHDYTTENS